MRADFQSMREIWAAHGRPDPAPTFSLGRGSRVTNRALERANALSNQVFDEREDLWSRLSDAARHAIIAGASGVKIPAWNIRLVCRNGAIITVAPL
jgi:hypothetical protein